MDRVPLNIKYCKEVKCPSRKGNKCTVPACTRAGCEKRAIYFTEHGCLPDGDKIDA